MENSEEEKTVNKEKNFIDELKKLQEKVEKIEKKNQQLEEKIEKIEKKHEKLEERLEEHLNTFNKEKKQLKNEFIKREESKKRYLNAFKILFSVMFVSSIVFFVYKMQTKITPYVSSVQIQEYSSFVRSWNEQVKNITTDKSFLLSFSKNNKNIQKLNSLLQNFYIAEITNSAEYNAFLEKNKFDKAIILNTRMKEEILLNHLKEVTKKTVISSIVKKILIMNDKNIWEKHKNDEYGFEK